MKWLNRYIIGVSILTILVLAFAFAFIVLAPEQWVSRVLIFIPLLFFVISVSTRALFFRSGNHDGIKIARATIAANGLRFFLFLMTAVVYSFSFPDDSAPFLLSFLFVYLFFATFEAVWNYNALKARK